MNIKYLKRIVLGVGLWLSMFVTLFAIVTEKFELPCTFQLSEKRELIDFHDGNGPISTFIRGEKTVKWCEVTVFSLVPFFPLFLLSLLTYRLKDEVFLAWWNFAKWWVPVIIGVTLYVENAGGGGGWGMNGGAFDAYFIGIFYIIFIAVSLVKIVRAYLRTRGKK